MSDTVRPNPIVFEDDRRVCSATAHRTTAQRVCTPEMAREMISRWDLTGPLEDRVDIGKNVHFPRSEALLSDNRPTIYGSYRVSPHEGPSRPP